MVLGLDLSSTVCGWTVLNEAGEVIDINYYAFNDDNTLVEKGEELEKFLLDINTKYTITECFIEERLKAFKAGGTNAEAMMKTAAMNYLGQFLMKKQGLVVKAINVNSARSAVFPGFKTFARTIAGVKEKEVAFSLAVKQLGESTFPTKVMSRGPRKGETVLLDEARDMADAWVIAKAGIVLKNTPVKVKKTKKTK